MAKVILSSKFIKTPSNKNIGKLLRYIGTREGVEKVAKGKVNVKVILLLENRCKMAQMFFMILRIALF